MNVVTVRTSEPPPAVDATRDNPAVNPARPPMTEPPPPQPAASPLGAMARARRATWGYRVHRLLQRLTGGRAALHAYLFCAQPIGAGAFGALMRSDPNTSVQAVSLDDPILADLPRPPEAMARRRAAGARCYVARVKGRFAGCIWIAHGRYDEDELRCTYLLPEQPRSVWDFDVYVDPAYRAGRTLARLWQAVDQDLAREGVRWSCSRISLYNPMSILTHDRLGARLLGTGWFLVLGPCQAAWLDGRLHLGWRGAPGHTPALRLRLP